MMQFLTHIIFLLKSSNRTGNLTALWLLFEL